MPFYSDRHHGPVPRVQTEIDEGVGNGILGLVRARVSDGSFGLSFPDPCEDGRGTIGTDIRSFKDALAAYRLYNAYGPCIPAASTTEILDLIEFAYEKISEAQQRGYHDYFGHHHLVFDQAAGRMAFRDEINRIFERNGIAYELKETGEVDRVAPEVIRQALSAAVFRTNDDALDDLLEKSRQKFLSRDPVVRRESLEALWDAWERLKSLELPGDKRQSIKILLDHGSGEPNLRQVLETEALALTAIGNGFMIRHTEIDKTPIADDADVDFLFHRLFALIRLLLKKTNRGG